MMGPVLISNVVSKGMGSTEETQGNRHAPMSDFRAKVAYCWFRPFYLLEWELERSHLWGRMTRITGKEPNNRDPLSHNINVFIMQWKGDRG